MATPYQAKSHFTYMQSLSRLIIPALAFLLLPQAQAGDEKRPPATIFTPPPQQADSIPTFVGGAKKAQPGSAGNAMTDNIPESLDDLLALPTLNSQQRKDLDKLRNDSRKDNQPLREELDSIKEKLRAAKENPQAQRASPAAGASSPSLANAPAGGAWLPDQSPAVSELKARSGEIEKELADRKGLLWQHMKSVITAEQFEDFKKMKHGQLIPPALLDSRQ